MLVLLGTRDRGAAVRVGLRTIKPFKAKVAEDVKRSDDSPCGA
jgi:hypothetical protein